MHQNKNKKLINRFILYNIKIKNIFSKGIYLSFNEIENEKPSKIVPLFNLSFFLKFSFYYIYYFTPANFTAIGNFILLEE